MTETDPHADRSSDRCTKRSAAGATKATKLGLNSLHNKIRRRAMLDMANSRGELDLHEGSD